MNNDHIRSDGGQETENDLNRDLDAALAKYAAVEPRAGLEERVLANLRAKPAEVTGRSWWRWGVAAAVAAAIVLAIALALKPEKPQQDVAKKPQAVPTQNGNQEKKVASNGGSGARPRSANPVRISSRAHVEGAAVIRPKLDHFPSLQPPSPEELALRRYVSDFPEEATLIARAQEEFEKEVEQKMDEARPQIDGKSFDQQER